MPALSGLVRVRVRARVGVRVRVRARVRVRVSVRVRVGQTRCVQEPPFTLTLHLTPALGGLAGGLGDLAHLG